MNSTAQTFANILTSEIVVLSDFNVFLSPLINFEK